MKLATPPFLIFATSLRIVIAALAVAAAWKIYDAIRRR